MLPFAIQFIATLIIEVMFIYERKDDNLSRQKKNSVIISLVGALTLIVDVKEEQTCEF